MNRLDLFEQIKQKSSYLCIGLDPDLEKLPKGIKPTMEGILEFQKRIIEATHDLCIAYKPNTAFFESFGQAGWELLEKTLDLIPKEHFLIIDAKRGDIGNTSKKYAEAFFSSNRSYRADAITINPYMGEDSIRPFLDTPNKWAIILALTSNLGSQNFQQKKLENGRYLFEEVILESQKWGSKDQIMYVLGATHPDQLAAIRKLAPDHFLLVPGVGTQGGDLKQISERGLNLFGGLLINITRSILYASAGEDFAAKAREEAQKIQYEMARYLMLYLPNAKAN